MTTLATRICLNLLSNILIILLLVLPVSAEEIIEKFHSEVSIAASGELTVEETITVRAEGLQIKRGIYRDFPLMVETASGAERKVGFDIVSVHRDGKPEPYFTEGGSRSIRIYIGDKNVYLQPGLYTYKLIYTTDRQIRYFDKTDELLWNVTGNFWDFPITRASANITLPGGGKALRTIAFTGGFGSTEQNAEGRLLEEGAKAFFQTTRPLQRREGLTVGVEFPKGIVAPPTSQQQLSWFLRDFLGEILAAFGFLVTTIYYFWNWLRVGRDPPSGIMVPRWDPPDGISPALTNYIYKKGLAGKGWDAIASAILNLAVKGRLKLENLSGEIHLLAEQGRSASDLPVGEAAILKLVNRYKGELIISKNNGSKVKRLQSVFSSAMSGEHRNKFYQNNIGIIVGGIALSILSVILVLSFGNLSEETVGLFIFLGIGGTIVTIILVNIGRAIAAGSSLAGKVTAVITMGFLGFTGMSMVVPFFLRGSDAMPQPILFTTLIGIIVINVVFFFLMGAPTPLGQKMLDGIEGLKQYLVLAEKDRMNLIGSPKMSPEHYETLLPYAVALGVEKPWSKAFETWLVAAVATGAVASTWHPTWYEGSTFDADRIGDAMTDISTSMQDSLTESMPAPKSSSSGFFWRWRRIFRRRRRRRWRWRLVNLTCPIPAFPIPEN